MKLRFLLVNTTLKRGYSRFSLFCVFQFAKSITVLNSILVAKNSILAYVVSLSQIWRAHERYLPPNRTEMYEIVRILAHVVCLSPNLECNTASNYKNLQIWCHSVGVFSKNIPNWEKIKSFWTRENLSNDCFSLKNHTFWIPIYGWNMHDSHNFV